MGYLFEGKFHQDILDKNLTGLAEKLGLKVVDPLTGVTDLLKQIVESDAILVAYTEAEKILLNQLIPKNLFKTFKDICYLNLRPPAKKWINRHNKARFNSLPPFRKTVDTFYQKRMQNSLASIMRLTSFEAPSDYAPLKTTARFNTIANALVRKDQCYEGLTPTQKRKGTQALKHNEFDVRAMEVLFQYVKRKDISCFSGSLKLCFEV